VIFTAALIRHSQAANYRMEQRIRVRSVWKPPESQGPRGLVLNALRGLNARLRRSLHYINGAQTLWYLKLRRARAIDRQSITLTLAAMHRLSEICRYRPSELESFLNGQKNWLLSEFVATSPPQFLDEVACEMTGQQVMIPNVRAPI